jgi:peptidyl-prolyl cis-trans isomerase D
MLQQMREWFRYLKWILLVIIVMFLWWVFVPGGSSPPARDAGWAARVNGTTISVNRFQAYARQLDDRFQSLLGEQYAQQRSIIRIGQQAIDALVEEELLYQEAIAQGILVSRQEVAKAITRDPSLQENGVFIGLERYRQLFRGGGSGVARFESQLHRDLVIEKLRNLLQDGVDVHQFEVEEAFLQRNERLIVDYLVVDRDDATAGGTPDGTEIARYYEEHLDLYTLGEGRRGLYVLFTARELAEGQEVTEAEVRQAYDRSRDTRFTRPAQRRASHILFKLDPSVSPEEDQRVQEKARSVQERARSGEDFAALAREFSEDSSKENGGDLNFFGRGRMVKEFEEAAFSMAVGEISDLVRSSFGYHIIKVTDEREGQTISYEEAHDQLLQDLKMDRARAEVLRHSTDFARAAAAGSLEAAAKSRGLTVSETGVVRAGDALPGLAASQSITARMMSMNEGEVSEAIPVPAGQAIVQVTGVTPPEPQPLSEVRSLVVENLLDDRALDAVEGAIADLRSRGGDIKALGRQLKTELRTQEDLSRGSPLPGVPSNPGIRRQLRDLEVGVLGGPVPTPDGLVVLSIRERRDNLEELDLQRDSIRDSLARQKRDRLYRALLRRLREQSDIELNGPLVAALDEG